MHAPSVPRSSKPRSPDGGKPRLTWTTAPRHFPPGRQQIMGPIVLATYDWSQPRRGSPRMFDQPFLEWFTTVQPWSLPAVYLPLCAWTFWHGLELGIPAGLSTGLFFAGLLLWTLLEYVIHRYSFHFVPRGRVTAIAAYLIHGVHHAYPDDHRRWVTPPALSLPIAAALYFAFRLVLGPYVNPIGSGVALGYLLYDLTHWVIHRAPLKSKYGRFLRTYHMQHHYSTPERRFGVSTPFWDYVFRTHR